MIQDPHAYEERAAIREYDGGFGRAKAEWLARADIANAHQTQYEPRQRTISTQPLPSVVRQVDPPSQRLSGGSS